MLCCAGLYSAVQAHVLALSTPRSASRRHACLLIFSLTTPGSHHALPAQQAALLNAPPSTLSLALNPTACAPSYSCHACRSGRDPRQYVKATAAVRNTGLPLCRTSWPVNWLLHILEAEPRGRKLTPRAASLLSLPATGATMASTSGPTMPSSCETLRSICQQRRRCTRRSARRRQLPGPAGCGHSVAGGPDHALTPPRAEAAVAP